MLLAFFAYHRLIFLQHANVSKHFRQTFLHAFVPLYHLCQGRLLSVVQHLVDAVSQHLSVDVIRCLSTVSLQPCCMVVYLLRSSCYYNFGN